jgi:hypothetical protein
MQSHLILGLVIVVFGGVLAAVIIYHVLRYLRGSIKLSLPCTAFNPGDAIAGSFELMTKKEIQGNKLIVSLIGMKTVRTHHEGKKRTRTEEVYRDEVVIEGKKNYFAGYTATYAFQVKAPNLQAPDFLNSHVGQILGATIRLLSDQSSGITWKVEARLDAKGVDLATSRPVSIR